jgi:hypothetical protein
LLRYLDNDLSEQAFKYLRAHLDTCVYCQDRLERERALSYFLHESRRLYSAPAEPRIQVSAAIERNSVRYQSRWDWWQRASPLVLNWKTLVPVSLIAALCFMAVPNIVQNARAASYVEAALTNHNRHLHGELSPGIRTKSPGAVTAWFADKLPFQFRLASFGSGAPGEPHLRIGRRKLGAISKNPSRHGRLRGSERNDQPLVESSKAAVVAGEDESHYGALMFHYRNEGRFEVIT